jgi:competence ComEA-like helix-hairpin-helix protein
MGEFYDEEKIKAMEEAASKAAPQNPGPNPASLPPSTTNKPVGGHFYDEAKIRAMEAGSSSSRASNFGTYALIAIIVVVVCGVMFWKFTHNPDTMIVNVNTASATEIAYLPGIGEAKAKVIIDHRPYHSIDDLKKVPGIGEKTFEKMKPRVKVE